MNAEPPVFLPVPVRHRDEHVVGVVSDTHGILRPEVLTALAGVEHILHAGDVGAPEVLDALAAIAPIVAVRGNNDKDPWVKRLRETEEVAIAGARILVLHDVNELVVDLATSGVAAVISGHSHRPGVDERGGGLYFNRGSRGCAQHNGALALALGKPC